MLDQDVDAITVRKCAGSPGMGSWDFLWNNWGKVTRNETWDLGFRLTRHQSSNYSQTILKKFPNNPEIILKRFSKKTQSFKKTNTKWWYNRIDTKWDIGFRLTWRNSPTLSHSCHFCAQKPISHPLSKFCWWTTMDNNQQCYMHLWCRFLLYLCVNIFCPLTTFRFCLFMVLIFLVFWGLCLC